MSSRNVCLLFACALSSIRHDMKCHVPCYVVSTRKELGEPRKTHSAPRLYGLPSGIDAVGGLPVDEISPANILPGLFDQYDVADRDVSVDTRVLCVCVSHGCVYDH